MFVFVSAMCEQVPIETREGHQIPGTGVTSSCKASEMSAGN